ncbi:MAG TPA: protein kinase [Pyrinomonadaceae bacterium]|jgi:serine/threonine-protein kinase|nr:protein kinase [Pyrinomonadaceae bacterium]
MVESNEDITQVLAVPNVGRFTDLTRIGEGGMGVLYKAFDPKLKRSIALKFLHKPTTLDPDSETRFLNEARAAAALDHPNVCTVYDIGSVGDELYIAMAFIEGQSLKQKIEKALLTFEEAVEIGIQVALGLREAHSAAIIHRDIKPSNILVGRGGVIKIVDFGLALLPTDERVTRENRSIGTPAYMSPEQVGGQGVDHRTDLWSLGVTLYEAVSGTLPFSPQSIPVLLRAILLDEIDWTQARKNNALSRLEPVLRRLMTKDRDRRYSSADEVLSDLKALSVSVSTATASLMDQSCIAVLPFVNLNREEKTEYFSDGLTDELINALAQFEGLRVVSRSSAFAFKGQSVSIKTIGEQLKVPTVLEGSVRSVGNRLRVTVQLTNVADGFNVWSERFDRELKDIFELQDEITLGIVEKLKVKLTPNRTTSPDVTSTARLQAHDAYLEGKYNWNRQTEEGFHKAILGFEKATQIDPSYGAAHAGLADAYTFLGFHGLAPSLEIFSKARAAAAKALELDPKLPDANISMGYVKLYHDWDCRAAEFFLRRAVELNPSSAKALYSLMLCLVQTSRFDEGRDALEKALLLDPFNMMYQTSAGWLEYYAKRPRVAVERLEQALKIDKTYPELWVALAAAYEQLGLFKDSIEYAEKAASIYGKHPLVHAFLGSAYATAGEYEKALSVLSRLDELSATQFVPSVCRAIVYMALQDTEAAFTHLQAAAKNRDAFLCWLNVLPLGETLRSDPRFEELISQIGLDQSSAHDKTQPLPSKY